MLYDVITMIENTYNTGSFMLMNVGNKPVESSSNLISTVAWQIGNEITYALEGSAFAGGTIRRVSGVVHRHRRFHSKTTDHFGRSLPRNTGRDRRS